MFNVKPETISISRQSKNVSSPVAKFCLELLGRFISKVAFTRQTEVSNLVLSNRIWGVKTLQKKKISMFESRFGNVRSRQLVFDNTSLRTSFSLVKMILDC